MSAKYPVLPIAGGTLVRVFASVLAFVTRWLKELLEARRHRREANVLAGSTVACSRTSALPVPTCMTPFPSPSGTIRLRSCASAHLSAGSTTWCAAPNSISAAADLYLISPGGKAS